MKSNKVNHDNKKKKNKEKEQPRVLEQSSLKILTQALKLETELNIERVRKMKKSKKS